MKPSLPFSLLALLTLSTALWGKEPSETLINPEIRSGIARIEGQVLNYKPKAGENGLTISIGYTNIITGARVNIESKVNASNKFALNVPLYQTVILVGFNVATNLHDYGWRTIGLNQDKPLQLTLKIKDSTDFELSGKGGLELSIDDMLNVDAARSRFFEFNTWDDYAKMTPEAFFEKTRHAEFSKRFEASIDSLTISKSARAFLLDDCTLLFLKGRVLVYKIVAEQDFSNNGVKTQYADFSAVEPDLTAYSFLKEYDLNNPKYLYCFTYPEFLRRFLAIAAFKIPIIGEQNIDDWLKVVTKSTKEVVGFDSGLFYDLLVANAYAIQVEDEKKPLTERQIENIKIYFSTKNTTFATILLKQNEELVRVIAHNNDLNVCEVPSVGKEALMDSILARYKGHVVLVDFWATWCSPCIEGHKSMKPLKDALKDKGVKFVYFTTVSSPKTLWEGKIKEIGGEQYYLSNEAWEYLLDKFGFEGIPSYLIIDKAGTLNSKFTGFPGVERMRTMLEELNK